MPCIQWGQLYETWLVMVNNKGLTIVAIHESAPHNLSINFNALHCEAARKIRTLSRFLVLHFLDVLWNLGHLVSPTLTLLRI